MKVAAQALKSISLMEEEADYDGEEVEYVAKTYEATYTKYPVLRDILASLTATAAKHGFTAEIDNHHEGRTTFSIRGFDFVLHVNVVMPLVRFGTTRSEHVYLAIPRERDRTFQYPNQYSEVESLILKTISSWAEEAKEEQALKEAGDKLHTRMVDATKTGTEWVPHTSGEFGRKSVFLHSSARFSVVPVNGCLVVISEKDPTILDEIVDMFESVNWKK